MTEQADDPIDIQGGRWNHLPLGTIITGVKGTSTLWRITAGHSLSKIHQPKPSEQPEPEPTPNTAETSPEIASLGAKLMHDDDPEVRKVAASVVRQASNAHPHKP